MSWFRMPSHIRDSEKITIIAMRYKNIIWRREDLMIFVVIYLFCNLVAS